MINIQIVEFIKRQLQVGETQEKIRNDLLANGWTDADINEALISLAPQNIPVIGQALPTTKSLNGSEIGSLQNQLLYASFPRRAVGFFVDALIIWFIVQIILFIITTVFSVQLETLMLKSVNTMFLQNDFSGLFFTILISALKLVLVTMIVNGFIYLIYKSLFESSKFQATIGKLLTGLKVCDLSQNRISFWRALGRNLASFLSIGFFMIGYIFTLFTDKKQTLHDIIAKTIVVDSKHYPASRLWIIFIAVILINILIPSFSDKNDIEGNRQRLGTETAKSEEKYGLVDSVEQSKMAEDMKQILTITEPANYDLIIQECFSEYSRTLASNNSSEEMAREQFRLLLSTNGLVFSLINSKSLAELSIKGVWLNAEKTSARLQSGGASLDVEKIDNIWVPVTLAGVSNCINSLSGKIFDLQKTARAALPQIPPFEIPKGLINFNEKYETLTSTSPYFKIAEAFLSDDYFSKLKETQKGYSLKYQLKRELNSSTADLQKVAFFSEITTNNTSEGKIQDKNGKGFTGRIEIENYITTIPGVHPKSTYTFFIRDGILVAFEKWNQGEKTSAGYETLDFGYYSILIGDPLNGESCLRLNLGNGSENPSIERGTCRDKIAGFMSTFDSITSGYLYFKPL